MNPVQSNIGVIAGAAVALAMQIVLAPALGIGGVFPNFPAVFVVLFAVTRPERAGYLMPFFLGLTIDFATAGPVGPSAFAFVLASFASARFFMTMNNDTLFMAFITIAGGILITQLADGLFMLALGFDASAVQMLAGRVAPCTLYDCVLGFALYPLARRLVARKEPTQAHISNVR